MAEKIFPVTVGQKIASRLVRGHQPCQTSADIDGSGTEFHDGTGNRFFETDGIATVEEQLLQAMGEYAGQNGSTPHAAYLIQPPSKPALLSRYIDPSPKKCGAIPSTGQSPSQRFTIDCHISLPLVRRIFYVGLIRAGQVFRNLRTGTSGNPAPSCQGFRNGA